LSQTKPPGLGALVRAKREALHLSMDELAVRARVSRSTIHRIEHSHDVRPTASKLARVLATVQIDPQEARAVIPWGAEYVGDVLH
jgi:transcriptional regulator with XRE-family HTH domain